MRQSVTNAADILNETGETIMTLQTLIKKHSYITADGAMGTYFSELTGLDPKYCESYNTISPELIRQIHNEYIKAGAMLLRTNTFSANSYTLGITHDELSSILKSGYKIAEECAGETAVVCADVSVIYQSNLSAEEINAL